MKSPKNPSFRKVILTPMKLRNYIFLLCFVILGCVIAVLNHLTKDRIENIEDGYLGNTAGNINNGGYFCEEDDIVYFSNFYDNNTLYCMRADESDIRKLSDQSVQYLNAAGRHLYYFQSKNLNGSDLGSAIQSTGLYRCDTNGKNIHCLKRGVINTMLLNGNRIYYQFYNKESGFTLYHISTTGKEDTQVTEYIANPACGYLNYIYFNGTQNDHNLYRLDVQNDQITRIFDGNMWNPTYAGGYLYYTDLSDGYRLGRLNLNSGESEIISDRRADFFNVSDQYVFFQTAGDEEAGLYRIRLDGSEETLLASGVYSNLSVTSQYLYFTAYDSTTMYHCSLNSDYPEEFRSAFDAAFATAN